MKGKKLKQIAREIKKLKIQGASNVRKEAIKAIKKSVQESKQKNVKSFLKEFKKNLVLLLNARPTEPELRTAIRILLKKALIYKSTSLKTLKKEIISACDNYFLERKQAMKKIAEFGVRKLPRKAIVFTHCHSHTVEEILKLGWKKGKLKRVICTETRPLFQGHITAKNLTKAGIPVTLIVDSASSVFLKEADWFLTGADAILGDGSIVNKIGTNQISLSARNEGVPHFVATSSHGFDPNTFFGVEEIIEKRRWKEVWRKKFPRLTIKNPAFDVTPEELIEGIITEKGIFSPESLAVLMYKELGLNEKGKKFLNVFELTKKLR